MRRETETETERHTCIYVLFGGFTRAQPPLTPPTPNQWVQESQLVRITTAGGGPIHVKPASISQNIQYK